MSNQDYVMQIKANNNGVHIIGERVHVIAARRRVRPTMAAPVKGDATQAMVAQEGFLIAPYCAGNSPAMHEQYRPACTRIAVKEFNAVACPNCRSSSRICCTRRHGSRAECAGGDRR